MMGESFVVAFVFIILALVIYIGRKIFNTRSGNYATAPV